MRTRSVQFTVTIFLSAFLLFQVQPILGRYALPWFGGTPAVWTNCLLFFQFALLAGYAYAHWLGSWRNVRLQAIVHSGLLAASFLMLPIIPEVYWKPTGNDDPSWRILIMLTATVGAPYFLLASTAPLLQRWHTLQFQGESPWRLYALSNAGSFLALLTYPFVVEPVMALNLQAIVWSTVYAVFAGLCAWTAWGLPRVVDAPVAEAEDEPAPSLLTIAFWMALSAAATVILMGTTNEISQEIAVSPFLWIAPLSVYLLTFVLAFDRPAWYHRKTFSVLAGVLAPAAGVVTTVAAGVSITIQFAVYMLALFVTCMVCNGELVLARPGARYLTTFYLCVAGGGAIGGIFTALIAPRVFNDFYEYPIGLAAACFLGFLGWMRSGALREWTMGHITLRVALMALLIGGVSAVMTTTGFTPPMATYRNFFGILRIAEVKDAVGLERRLTHGRIKHGFQYQGSVRRYRPTSYYGANSGIGIVLTALEKPKRRIGIVGLGTGTIAAYGREGDTFRFYEINPDVVSIANQWFTYLKDSPAKTEVVLGDARVQLERELNRVPAQMFDVLAVDAFSSDAIPIHLLTAECGDIYARHLAPGGLLLLHISNRSVNLEPVVRGLAQHLGWQAVMFLAGQNESTGEDASRWVLLTRNKQFLGRADIAPRSMGWTMPAKAPVVWTDDFASLWSVVRF